MTLDNWNNKINYLSPNHAFFIKNNLSYSFIINYDKTENQISIRDINNNLLIEIIDKKNKWKIHLLVILKII